MQSAQSKIAPTQENDSAKEALCTACGSKSAIASMAAPNTFQARVARPKA